MFNPHTTSPCQPSREECTTHCALSRFRSQGAGRLMTRAGTRTRTAFLHDLSEGLVCKILAFASCKYMHQSLALVISGNAMQMRNCALRIPDGNSLPAGQSAAIWLFCRREYKSLILPRVWCLRRVGGAALWLSILPHAEGDLGLVALKKNKNEE